jgi:ABC-type protease/lipase transport system fused ATPase/permease subunit
LIEKSLNQTGILFLIKISKKLGVITANTMARQYFKKGHLVNGVMQMKMPSRELKRRALKESVSDTILASIINLPLNFVLIGFCFWMEMTVFTMSIFMTAVFTVLAVIRKYYVRLYFARGD